MELKQIHYKHFVLSFKEWLHILGYGETCVNSFPRMLQEFFCWLEDKNIQTLSEVQTEHSESFIEYHKTRANRRRAGGISPGHINRYIEVLKKFNEYLKQAKNFEIPLKIARLEDDPIKEIVILTMEEIQAIYGVTDNSHFGIRDRAMLSIYYGCGLRKGEGVQLDVEDILIERKLVHIKKSKNNYERQIPITTSNLNHLLLYLHNIRPLLLADKSNENALFVSERGHRISKDRFYQRLKILCLKAGITKDIGIHTLRHSIATHLLQKGMELENIAMFLGHKCLDSTQIYTHILNEE
ncbi:MAG: tyrosine-type recombinase/integrase [Bacteroidetes bacterium]|nr:tyrosine-type recombinase/integrase [Bacteroidota bacterium]MBN8703782.1 tyrosine-type recombinase/integrase [Bacteroidota bacterium]